MFLRSAFITYTAESPCRKLPSEIKITESGGEEAWKNCGIPEKNSSTPIILAQKRRNEGNCTVFITGVFIVCLKTARDLTVFSYKDR